MPRHGLTDTAFELIADLLPQPRATGRPPKDMRLIVDAILWILATGSAWRDLPTEYGPWQSVYDYFNQWAKDGTLDQILLRLTDAFVAAGEIEDDLWCVDGTSIRAGRWAAGAGQKGGPTSLPITLSAALGVVSARSCTSSATPPAIR